MTRKPRTYTLLNLLLLVLSASLALSLTMRVFGFYAMPHILKLVTTGYLALVLAMVFFRFARPGIVGRLGRRGHNVMSVGAAVLVTLLFFILVGYHIAPIRTTHSLEIQNTSSSAEVSVWEIILPGEEPLDLAATFGEDQFGDDRLLIPPGTSIDYSREMTGGVTVRLGAMDWPAQAKVGWDGIVYDVAWEDNGDAIAFDLPGWTWGAPSLPYRAFGFLNIATDLISVFGLAFLGAFLLLPFPEQEGEQRPTEWDHRSLQAFTLSIMVNLVIMIGTAIYAGFFQAELSVLMLLFGIGVLLFLRDILKYKLRWVLWVVFVVLVMGIALNAFIWIQPINEAHQTLRRAPLNTFYRIAQQTGNSTYLSMGFYKGFRGSQLHIPRGLLDELALNAENLERINIGAKVIIDEYNYYLSDQVVDRLLETYDWQSWPREVGGSFYMSLDLSSTGVDYYFFKSGERYLIVPYTILVKSGDIDVPILD